jgi:thiamine pyrophosphate-dependent acetolactate synthase large subunit-like protein
MKVKRTVEMKFHTCFASWNSLEFTEESGDEVSIKMTDHDFLSFAETMQVKANRIRKEQAEEAAEQQRALEAKENEDA